MTFSVATAHFDYIDMTRVGPSDRIKVTLESGAALYFMRNKSDRAGLIELDLHHSNQVLINDVMRLVTDCINRKVYYHDDGIYYVDNKVVRSLKWFYSPKSWRRHFMSASERWLTVRRVVQDCLELHAYVWQPTSRVNYDSTVGFVPGELLYLEWTMADWSGGVGGFDLIEKVEFITL